MRYPSQKIKCTMLHICSWFSLRVWTFSDVLLAALLWSVFLITWWSCGSPLPFTIIVTRAPLAENFGRMCWWVTVCAETAPGQHMFCICHYVYDQRDKFKKWSTLIGLHLYLLGHWHPSDPLLTYSTHEIQKLAEGLSIRRSNNKA